ncbi:MAG: phage tail protein [Aeromonas popoffii]|uniref:phage tail-collar fiber domain-containing protein n=1 Tax=Aeromonas popoffii TaxID=70856 RepID=UPI003F2C8079
MSQVITNAFEHYWQSSLATEQPVVLDEFILADIPNLDITSPIDPDTGLPPESQIVHRQNVDQRGRINNNAVAYTIVMDTTVGDFSFNAMYLRNKQNGVIGMIVYKGRETKLKTDQTTGQTGNSLVKSMLMGYDQAAEATLTHVDAGTWQIDYAARLRGMDEDLRQLASQLYGHHTFIGDGFKVVQQDGGHQVTQGVAIVGGLRIELKQPQVIHPGTKPIGVWVDVHRSGSLLSEHQNHFTIITSVVDLTDHVDDNGYQHYVAKVATIFMNGLPDDERSENNGGGGIPGTFNLWKRSMAEAGYSLVEGSFELGGVLPNQNSVMLDISSETVWSWNGEFPHAVIKGTDPKRSGGNYRQRTAETLRKTSFDLFGATDSPFSPSYQELKIVVGGGNVYPGKMFVLTKGGGGNGVMIRLFNGNVSAPALPSNSENGNWALWRTGIVQAIEYAWVYKKPSEVIGSWIESDVTYSAVDIYSDPMLGAYMSLKRRNSSTGGTGNRLGFNVNVGIDGNLKVGFLGTETGPLEQKINIDGSTVMTVNLRTSVPSILCFDIKVAPGQRVVSIPHEEVRTNLNVIGVNFLSINELSHWNVDVDSWASYNKSPSYITSEGASDYAFRAKGGENNWAGSYHGGEYERAAPEFSLDHQVIEPSDSFIGIGRRLSILQRTQLRWSSSNESVDIDSLTMILDASIFMQCAVSNANLVAHTAFTGMNTASPAYDSAIGSKYYDAANADGTSYAFGPCQQITQIERGSGRIVYTRFSRPPLLDNSYGGATVSYAKGAYAKVYSGFVRNSAVKLPSEFSFSFQKAFI